MDKITFQLLEALKRAVAEPGEQRLFRSGKLPGLFSTRTGSNGHAAERAVRDGLLEVVRSEPKGKTQTDWVRATPKAVDFVHTHESPTAAMKELHAVLQSTQDGIPAWLASMRQRMERLTDEVNNEVNKMAHRLESLRQRVEEAIARVESAQPQVTEKVADLVPWANDVLKYLERRTETGGETPCPLSELFAALKTDHPDLSVTAFHSGLRRLFDRSIVRLLPFEGSNGFPEPEYALLDGFNTYYYATRAGL